MTPMRQQLLLFIVLLFATAVQAQITGRVEDTLARKPLHMAVVAEQDGWLRKV